jgi:hypothetical protein
MEKLKYPKMVSKVTNLNYIVEEPSPGGLSFTVEKGKITENFCF